MPPDPDAGGTPADGLGPGDDGPLVCMRDDVEVDRGRPRCLHPTSQCRFRDWCEVAALARRRAGSRAPPPEP
ncbi:MAG: hypothetical protein ACYTKD_13150 [Planctomycetota bacterium]